MACKPPHSLANAAWSTPWVPLAARVRLPIRGDSLGREPSDFVARPAGPRACIDVDAQTANGNLDLRVSEQYLHSAQVPRLFVDEGRLGPAKRMRLVILRAQSNTCHPLIDEATILSGADMFGVIDSARHPQNTKTAGLLSRAGTIFNAHGAFARRDAKAVSISQTAGPVAKPAASFRKRRTLPGERNGHSLRSGGTLVQPTTRIEQWPTGPATTAST